LPDATFDQVLCGFGIMFLPDRFLALSEFRRVMTSGGRLTVSTWRVSQTSEKDAAMSELGLSTSFRRTAVRQWKGCPQGGASFMM
jgi:ubiquinone/menaquinone biosynthesis C-methylase UbiE